MNNFVLAEDQKFESLFDGKTLNGWEPMPGGTWEVIDGAIVGKSPKTARRHGMLLSKKQYSDFVVKAKFRVIKGDSGFYFRSARVKSAVSVNGFQVEVDTSQETGGLYETGGRAWVHQPTAEVVKQRNYQQGEWTDLELSAIGKHLVVKINGVVSTELINDPGRSKGYFGLQLHGGQEMHVEFKDLVILEK
ncbi:MAG: 3-keto-disaccharide hydrolase [Pirellulales bacterium]